MRTVARTIALLGLGLLAGCGGGGGNSGGGGADTPSIPLSAHEIAQSRDEMAKQGPVQNTSFIAVVAKGNQVTIDEQQNSDTVMFTQRAGTHRYVNIDGNIGGMTVKRGIAMGSATSGRSVHNSHYVVDGTVYELSMYAPNPTGSEKHEFVEAGAGFFVDGAARELGLVAFAAGNETTALDDVPVAGSASYTGSAIAYYLGEGSNNLVGFVGDLRMGVDFAQKTTNFRVPILDSVSPGTDRPLTGFSGPGTISGNGFSGTLTQLQGGTMTGGYDGQFYGPQAAAAGGVFALGNSEGVLVGSFAAKK